MIFRGPSQPSWAHLVVVGAGDGQRAAAWTTLPALRRDLVEADPQKAALLMRTHDARASTRVWSDVVAPASGPVTWYRYLPGFLDGVVDAADLLDVYPRLRCVDRQDVDGISLGDLLVRFGVSVEEQGDRALVIDVPGARRLLAAGAAHRVVRAFAAVALRDPVDPVDLAADDLDADMSRLGFDAHAASDGWRCYRRDDARVARLEIEQALSNARERCASLARMLSQQEHDLHELRTAQVGLDQRVERLVERLSSAEAAVLDLRGALGGELEAARRSAGDIRPASEGAAVQQEAKVLQAQCRLVVDRGEALARRLADAEAALQSLHVDRIALCADLDSVRAELTSRASPEANTSGIRAGSDLAARDIEQAAARFGRLVESRVTGVEP